MAHTNTPITLSSTPVLTWEAPSRPTVERTARWHIIAGIMVIAAAAYGILTGSWSFAIVVVLTAGVYTLLRDHQPPTVRIELYDSGIRMNGSFMRWDEFQGFWFLRTPTYVELHFTPRLRRGEAVMQLSSIDPTELRMILGQRLPELTHKRERILDTFIRICKL